MDAREKAKYTLQILYEVMQREAKKELIVPERVEALAKAISVLQNGAGLT